MPEDASAEARISSPGERRQSLGQPAHDVFVSYSTHDKPTADAIVSRLEQAGIRCWVAPRDIIPGRVFGDAIEQAIETSRLMVVVFSGNTNQSHHVHREVERAVANDVVIIPFRIESVQPSGAMAYFLSSEHWLDAITPPLDAHIGQLVKVARMLLENTPVTTREQAPETAPPIPATAPPSRRRWLLPVLVAAGSVAILGLVAGLLFALVPSGPARPKAAQPKTVALARLTTGNCLETPQAWAQNKSRRSQFWNGAAWPTSFTVVPCRTLHSAEVFFSGNVWAAQPAYPGDKALKKQALAQCYSAFKTYVGVPYSESTFLFTYTYPDSQTWPQGDRQLLCVAFGANGSEFRNSIRGTGQ
jgi:TIR domain/Septum formation